MSIKDADKERLVNAFLRGESVTDLSAFFSVTRTTVEDVLRESICGLSALNKTLYKQLHPEPAADNRIAIRYTREMELQTGEPLHVVPASWRGND